MNDVAMLVSIELLVIGLVTFGTFEGADVSMVLSYMRHEIGLPIVCFIGTRGAVAMDVWALDGFVFDFTKAIVKG